MTDEDRRGRIRRAALDVFLRYGYRRTTMGDIAREVGVSRPALYLAFPGKEAVFREVVEVGLDEILRDIEAGLDAHAALTDRLRHVFELSSVRSFEMVSRAPAAGELIGASFDFVSDVFERYSQRLAKILADVIRAAVPEPDALQPSAAARARVMVAAAHGFKSQAKTTSEMRGLLDDLVRMTVAGLPVASPRPADATSRSRARARRRRSP